MCGIAGLWSSKTQGSSHFTNDLLALETGLTHRGPDHGDIWHDTQWGIGLAHRLLSMQDLGPSAHQPMLSPSGRYRVVFNGQIYNHLILRQALDHPPPHVWTGQSDTETFLRALDLWGIEETLKKSHGMFALGIWDQKEKTLFLARDRLGEKPLYYGWVQDLFVFSSEVSALKNLKKNLEISPEALELYLTYGYVPSPFSIYKGILKVPPGTWIALSLEDLHKGIVKDPVPYWSLKACVQSKTKNRTFAQTSLEDDLKTLDALLSEVVEQHLLSGVPLGSFLSGGIDSSLITALIQKQSSKSIPTFSVGFKHAQFDESPHARAIAQYLGTQHHEAILDGDSLIPLVQRLGTVYDEPFADSSQLPTLFLCEMARGQVKGILSGDGGDEMFGGYNRYKALGTLYKIFSFIPKPACAMATTGASWVLKCLGNKEASKWDPLRASWLQKFQKLIPALSQGDIWQAYTRLVEIGEGGLLKGAQGLKQDFSFWDLPELDFTERMMVADAGTYLPHDILVKVDRAAMSVGLETRSPFLDQRVVEYAWGLPLHRKIHGKTLKVLLRRLLDHYIPSKLMDRPKQGFSIPLAPWLRKELLPLAQDLFHPSQSKIGSFLDMEHIQHYWHAHKTGLQDHSSILWTVMMLELWYRG